MIYALSLVGAAAIGLGWILQHRAMVVHGGYAPLLQLIRTRLWWFGIAALTVGQTLTGTALQFGPITLVAPLLSVDLLCAYLARAALLRHRPLRREIVGAIAFAASLTAFVVAAAPRNTADVTAGQLIPAVWATVGVVVLAGAVVAYGTWRHGEAGASLTSALAAGLLYGLQDVATRGTLVVITKHGVATVVVSIWPYLLLASATAAVLLTQRAFRAARLDYVLPPIAASQSVVGVVLGVLLLRDRIDLGPPRLAGELVCLAVLITSVVLIGRSPALQPRRVRRRRARPGQRPPADVSGAPGCEPERSALTRVRGLLLGHRRAGQPQPFGDGQDVA